MKPTNRLPLLFVFLFACNILSPGQQSSQTLSLENSPIEEKFQYIYQRSTDYEDFKLVKRWQLNRLKTHVLDSLKSSQDLLDNANNHIAGQASQIDSLLTIINGINTKLDAAIKEKDSFTLLGMTIQKTGYNTMVWSIIAGLTFFILILFLLYRNSFKIIVQTRNDLEETRSEFDAFRKRALEREESVVRKYHNELIKYKSKVNQ